MNRVHQALSSFVKETGEQVSKWASNMCESESDKKFNSDLQKAIDMSVSAAKGKPPSYNACTSPATGSAFISAMDRRYIADGNNGGKCRVRFQPPAVPNPGPVKNFDHFPVQENSKPVPTQSSSPKKRAVPADTHNDLERAIALSYEEQTKAKGNTLPTVEVSDLDRAIALSYEEQAKAKAQKPTASILPEKKSVFGEDAGDMFQHMIAPPKEDQKLPAKVTEAQILPAAEATDNKKRLRAKFIEQRTFDVETGAVVDLSHIQPNTRVAHTWTMLNPSSTDVWPVNIVGKTVGGDPNIIKSSFCTSSPVAAHTPVHITVEAVAPNEPGRYISYFRLFDKSDRVFGDRIWLDMQVVGPSSDTDWDLLHEEAQAGQQQ